jgi:hypothetical protein
MKFEAVVGGPFNYRNMSFEDNPIELIHKLWKQSPTNSLKNLPMIAYLCTAMYDNFFSSELCVCLFGNHLPDSNITQEEWKALVKNTIEYISEELDQDHVYLTFTEGEEIHKLGKRPKV